MKLLKQKMDGASKKNGTETKCKVLNAASISFTDNPVQAFQSVQFFLWQPQEHFLLSNSSCGGHGGTSFDGTPSVVATGVLISY